MAQEEEERVEEQEAHPRLPLSPTILDGAQALFQGRPFRSAPAELELQSGVVDELFEGAPRDPKEEVVSSWDLEGVREVEGMEERCLERRLDPRVLA